MLSGRGDGILDFAYRLGQYFFPVTTANMATDSRRKNEKIEADKKKLYLHA